MWQRFFNSKAFGAFRVIELEDESHQNHELKIISLGYLGNPSIPG